MLCQYAFSTLTGLSDQMNTSTAVVTGHFTSYTLMDPLPIWLQNCLTSSWHRLNKVLETSLKRFWHRHWHDSEIQLLHIHDANLRFHHIQKNALLDYDLVTADAIWVKRTVYDDLSFVTWYLPCWKQSSEDWYIVVIKGQTRSSETTFSWYWGVLSVKKIFPTLLQHQQKPELLMWGS